jgi:SAM-dependent methyltransferase
VTDGGGTMDYERAGVAETYRRVRTLPSETFALWRDLLRELVPTRGIVRVADLGCGTGRFVGCLKEAFGVPVIGLDPSARMLAAADRAVAALDARRMPSRTGLRALFMAAGFAQAAQRTVEQRMSDGPEDYRERVRARSFSSLQQIPDDAFARGLARFEAWSAALPTGVPMHEPVDVLVFRR